VDGYLRVDAAGIENVTTTAKTASIVLFVTLEWRKASDLCPVIWSTKRKRACLNGHPANKTQRMTYLNKL
jgi:hypothetical protein